MEEMSQKLQSSMQQSELNSAAVDMATLRQILENLITLSLDQESLLTNITETNINSPQYTHYMQLQKKLQNDAQIIDMRNNFEYNLGTFKGAINLCLINFTDLKDKTAELNKLDRKKKTAIFCTGGIRCEKAGKYLSDIGFENVYQLQGGIINYLNSTKNKYWKGECFVFDDRILLKGNS